jgi:biotin carboxyl carrier protein
MKFVARRGESVIPVDVERSGSGYQVQLNGRVMSADLIPVDGHLQSLRLADGRHFLLTHHREGSRHVVSFGGQEVQLELIDPLALKRGSRAEVASQEGARVTAFMPGRVVRLLVEPGAEVKLGDGLLILEAMKMENEITAPRSGTVTAVLVTAGQTVESGAELVEIE